MMIVVDPYKFVTIAFTTGTFGSAAAASRNIGPGTQNAGFQFVAPASGVISTAKINVGVIPTVAGDWRIQLRAESAGSPGSQIGSNGASVTVSATGDVTFTGVADMAVVGGTTYWIVFVPVSGTPDFGINTCANDASYGSGRNDTITSITTTGFPSSEDIRCEIVATA